MKHAIPMSSLLALLLASAGASAERVVGFEKSGNKVTACMTAKHVADRTCPGKIDYYDSCECTATRTADGSLWSCTVEAECADREEQPTREERSDTQDEVDDRNETESEAETSDPAS